MPDFKKALLIFAQMVLEAETVDQVTLVKSRAKMFIDFPEDTAIMTVEQKNHREGK